MKDQDKTKEQLIDELGELHQRIAELETAEAERKRVEKALRDNEEQYRTTIDAMDEFVHVVDRDLDFVLSNEAFHEIITELGLGHDLVGQELFEVFPFLPHTVREEYEQVLRTGKPLVTEEPTEVGPRTVWTNTRKIPILDEQGRVDRILTIIRDITERKHAEETLRENQRFLQGVFDAIQDGISVLDRDLTIIHVNQWMEKMYAAHLPLVGKKCYEVYQQRQSPCPWCPSIPTFETGKAHTEIVPYPSAEKPTGWIELSAFPVKGVDGSAVRVIEHVKDITKRKQVEEALRESETRFRALSEATFEGIVFTRQGIIVDTNQQFANLLGYEIDEVRGVEVRQLIVPEDREFVWNKILTGSEEPHEHRTLHKDGTAIFVEVHPRMTSIEGQPVRVAAVRDITERKRAEEALQSSREQLELITDTVPALLAYVDSEQRYLYVNQAYADWYGLSKEELAGKCVRDVLSAESYQGAIKHIEAVLQGQELSFENVAYDQEGQLRAVRASYVPHIDENGLVKAFLAVVEDITERKQAEEALRESEENLRQAQRIAHLGSWALDLESNTFVVSEEMLRIYEYEDRYTGAVSMEEFAQYIHPDDKARVTAALHDAIAGVAPYDLEFRILRTDGQVRTLSAQGEVIKDEEGRPIRMVGSGLDITERKQAEEERERLLAQIRAQARRMQQILDTVPEGVVLLDTDERIILVNPVAEGELVVLADAGIGDTLTHLGDHPLAKLLTSPPRGLWHEVVADGRVFQAIARPIEDGATPTGWVLVIRDVTQQREIQQRIQQQERLAAVGQLAAGIAHDFNNILAAIVLYAQMTARMEGLPAAVRERMETIDGQAKHATNLIQQILDFSRRSVLERRPLDLAPLLKEHVKLLGRTLPENIEIRLDPEPDEYATSFTVNADPTRIQQMVTNLALNAREAMPRGGKLRIGLERIVIKPGESPLLPEMKAGEWVRVTVSDTGTGIPPHVLPHIFEPFFTTRAPLGSGLGLAQVHGIVGAHEGHIDVQTQVGQGTTFIIYLPIYSSKPSPLPTQEELPALPRGQGETILVVEDDAVVRKALADGLELLNYRVLEVANGQEALEMLEQRKGEVALVLSDVVMPQMGGVALLHALREQGLTVPVVMLTGHPIQREMEELRAQGMADWLPKPPRLEQLAEVTARILGTD